MRTASEYRATARGALLGKWGLAVIITLVAAILGAEGAGVSFSLDIDLNDLSLLTDGGALNVGGALSKLGFDIEAMRTALNWLFVPLAGISIVRFVIGGAVELGQDLVYIGLIRSEKPKFETLFSRMELVLKALGLRLFMALFIFLWSLLFVIPGIIAAYRYRMAPYLMAERRNMGIREAVNESKRMTEGHKSAWFWLDLSFIGWIFLALVTCGIGLLWLNPYMEAASAAFYLDIINLETNGNPAGDGGRDRTEPEFEYDGPERI